MAELDLEARRKAVEGLVVLRKELETGCDEELWPHVELNAVLLLSDVCKAIGLESRETILILGERGMQHVLETEDSPAGTILHSHPVGEEQLCSIPTG